MATAHKVPLNLLTSFFSSRGIALERDPLGRVRLTIEQATMFSQWRRDVAERAKQPEIMIDGEKYRSVKLVARSRAEQLYQPGSPRYERYLRTCEASLRRLSKMGGFGEETKCGMYIPASYAENYASRVSVPEAARLVGVSTSTIKSWRALDERLLPEWLIGRHCMDVALAPLLAFARRRYLEEPKLSKRDKVPSLLVCYEVRAIARESELDPIGVANVIATDEGMRKKVLSADSTLRRSHYEVAVSRLIELREKLGAVGHGDGVLARSPQAHTRVFSPNAQVFPAWKVVRLVTEIARAKNCSPEPLYSSVRDFFSLSPSWPITFEALSRLIDNDFSVKPYPLGVGASLERLLNSYSGSKAS